MFRVHAINHVSIIVSDTTRSRNFYEELLGFEELPGRNITDFPGAWLRAGKCDLHLLELPNPDPVSGRPGHVGRDRHIALSIDGIESLKKRLDARNISVTMSRSGRSAMFFRDPDGNGIEVVQAEVS